MIVELESPKQRGLRQIEAVDFPLFLTLRISPFEGKPVPHPAKRALPPVHRLTSVEVPDNERAYTQFPGLFPRPSQSSVVPTFAYAWGVVRGIDRVVNPHALHGYSLATCLSNLHGFLKVDDCGNLALRTV